MIALWYDAGGSVLQADAVVLPLNSSWQQASSAVIAPAGTATVFLAIADGAGGPGDVIFIDDVGVNT